jgi:iduronate 2-sulfatase
MFRILSVTFCWLLGLCAPNPLAAQGTPLNVLLICVDDLRPELNCYGANYIQSPHIDRLAHSGIRFTRHYVQAPTCGASRFALLTGCYGGRGNEALFQRARDLAADRQVPPSLPGWFRDHGYTTVAVGKVSHHPGGLGGPDWNDPQQVEMPGSWDRQVLPAGPWQHPRGWMHGLAHGEIRVPQQPMDVFQALPGEDEIYPDGVSMAAALEELDALAAAEKPFFLACGILRPHLPFGAPDRYLALYRDVQLPPIPHPSKPKGQTTWHASGEFNRYQRWGRDPNTDAAFADEVRRHYAACVSYADAQVGRLIDRLHERGLWERTVVVLWGDHGWHLGEHAVWGKHTLFEESLRSPLIIRGPGLPRAGESVEQVVQTVDIFPTLCQLTGLPLPGTVAGTSLVPDLRGESPADHARYAISYQPRAETIRSQRYRLIVHDSGAMELYDHFGPGESVNLTAQHPGVALELRRELAQTLDPDRPSSR